MKKFNTAGPSVADDHYMIPPLSRFDLEEIETLIDDKRYFILHAPRQTGKTTCLLALMEHLNQKGDYRALYANIEGAQSARGDVEAGIATVCSAIVERIQAHLEDPNPALWIAQTGKHLPAHDRLRGLLNRWAASDPRPAVLLLDEVDALVGDTLISLLRQIRSGYDQRPKAFPQSVVLCGVRDVRDYRIHTAHNEIITGGSAFNVKAESLRLGNFSREETETLWHQHETETGQTFDPEIWDELWEDTQGQPWLVNALGHQLTWKNTALRDRTLPITLEDYKKAREALIQSRATHLDALSDKLSEPRVHQVMSAFFEGPSSWEGISMDDQQYVEDLGLISFKPQLRISNRIYQEVIPREMTWVAQTRITHDQAWYVTPERKLDMPKLLTAFQQFFREHSEAWLDGFAYKEAGPHLLMQAFLQRIVNGGGRINREYGLGRKRTDLFLEWPIDEEKGYFGPVQKVVIELKLLRSAPEATLKEGLIQTAEYADKAGADEAYLVLFDRRDGKTWEERIWQRAETVQGREIRVWGM
jgi:hypothetical protein